MSMRRKLLLSSSATLPSPLLRYDFRIGGLLQTVGGIAAGTGDPCGQAADSGTRGITITQGTAAARPTVAASLPTAIVDGSLRSLSFDGGDSLANASAVGLPAGAAPRTLSAWVNYTSATAVYRVVFDYGAYTSGNRFAIALDNAAGAKKVYFSGWSNDALSNGTVANDGNWHHIAAVFAGGSSIAFYINGVFDSEKTITLLNTTTGTAVSVGKEHSASAVWLGSLADVRLYGVALSAAQIARIYGGR